MHFFRQAIGNRCAVIVTALVVLCAAGKVDPAQAQSAEQAESQSILVSGDPSSGHAHRPDGYRQYSARERGALFPQLNAAEGDPITQDIVLPTYQAHCNERGRLPRPEPIYMPLLYWKQRLFRHSDPNDPLRHMGVGNPLEGTSWRNRPLYAGFLIGGVWSDSSTEAVDQTDDLLGGFRLGYDFDHYWGSELRFAFANSATSGVPNPLSTTAGHSYYDINLLYYPLGDARWRPYAGVGVGLANFRFDDQLGSHVEETLIGIPLQIGVKYLYRKWLALRFDLADNIAIGGDRLNSMHNFSLTAGVEWHFGGKRRSYFPWSPSTALW